MKNKINFVTGEAYTLGELFSGNRKVIIPDLQRDYCWGDEIHTEENKELVSGFVANLIDQFTDKKSLDKLNLGLIYGYEVPENHIQLCDGQQRITTLYLLLGVLNRMAGNNAFRHQLISDYEFYKDDKEPYLQYAIRESSLYFLSDFVCNYFILQEGDKNAKLESIDDIEKGCSWYFNEYRTDPSVQSMIKAVRKIEAKLADKNSAWCIEFGNFLISQLTFLYYDLENRSNGEETFVVINTTGEPLSVTQNLKPLICNSPINSHYDKVPTHWEEIETWFWQNRDVSVGNDTADAGFCEFLRWVAIIHSNLNEQKRILQDGEYCFPTEEISFDDIYQYWQIVKFLFEQWSHKGELKKIWLSPTVNNDQKGAMRTIKQVDCFHLLPLIAYCKKWKVNDPNDQNLYRLYQFVHNLTRIENITKAINALIPDVIKIAEQCQDILDLIEADIKVSDLILSTEERKKLEILKKHNSNRNEIEGSFWQAQSCKIPCHNIWKGEIMPLINWASADSDFDIEHFKQYLDAFDKVFQGECDSNIDNVRRALLTRGLNNYPRVFRGNQVWSFGWAWKDWNVLINENQVKFKSFFDELIKSTSLQTALQAMIDNYPNEKNWAEFVHDSRLLAYCTEKKLQKWNNAWYLMKKERWSGAHANVKTYQYFLSLNDEVSPNPWGKAKFYEWDQSYVYYQRKCNDAYMTIKIMWDIDCVKIDLFLKPEDNEAVASLDQERLLRIAKDLGFMESNDRNRFSVDIDCKNDEIYKKINSIKEQIFKSCNESWNYGS